MNETLLTIITAVVIPILIGITPDIIRLIKAKTQQSKIITNNEQLKVYIDIAADAVETAVISVSQTFVDALKKAGSFDEAAQQVAFTEAKNKAILIMGDTARETLAQVYGDVDAWITNKIEAYTRQNKALM